MVFTEYVLWLILYLMMLFLYTLIIYIRNYKQKTIKNGFIYVFIYNFYRKRVI